MTNILEQFARDASGFRPETTHDFFALQLARKLNDLTHARVYAALADSFGEDVLLAAFAQTGNAATGPGAAEGFQIELRRLTRRKETYGSEDGSF